MRKVRAWVSPHWKETKKKEAIDKGMTLIELTEHDARKQNGFFDEPKQKKKGFKFPFP